MGDALSYFESSVSSSIRIIGRPEAIYVEILGNVQFTGEILPKFWQKVSCPKSSLVKEDIVLRSEPGVGVMPGSPQGSSWVLGNSGQVHQKEFLLKDLITEGLLRDDRRVGEASTGLNNSPDLSITCVLQVAL
ncbi:unnamed protein product [Prunus armeniaca]